MTAHPATLIVHCPSGPVAACEHHAKKIKSLMAFLGTHSNTTPAPGGAECANCKNEMKRPPGPQLPTPPP
jgi:hypothetical protein